jgi:hypothetical protein
MLYDKQQQQYYQLLPMTQCIGISEIKACYDDLFIGIMYPAEQIEIISKLSKRQKNLLSITEESNPILVVFGLNLPVN